MRTLALAFGFATAYSGGSATAAVPPAIAERAPAEGAAAAIAGEACNHAGGLDKAETPQGADEISDRRSYVLRTYVLAKNLRTHTRYARTYVRTTYVRITL